MKIFHVYFVVSAALLLAFPGLLRAGEENLISLFAKYQTKPLAGAPQAGEDIHGLYADLVVGPVTQRMRWIAAGSFTMGSPASEPDRKDGETPHTVTLTRGFWLGDCEVTQALWEAVMGANPSEFKHPANPVEQVSWEDCHEFHQRLNVKIAGLSARFPTEAEWEHACRAGTTTPFAGPSLDALGWYEGNSGEQTHAVKQKFPNAFGLYDMHGNVWEWCADWYDDYPVGAVSDPVGPASGSFRVYRGGSGSNLPRNCRSAYRSWVEPGNRYPNLGFRLLLVSPLFGEEPESAYNNGIKAMNKDDHDLAIKFYNEAIKLDPKHELAFVNRGVCFKRKGEYDKAIEDYNQAILLNPDSIMAYFNRALANELKGDFSQTIANYDQIIKIDPSDFQAYGNLAWILATNQNGAFRDGRKAVQYATKACELTEWESSKAIEILAAAYAEIGDFENAEKWQKKMLEFRGKDKNTEELIRRRLALYQDHKPLREP